MKDNIVVNADDYGKSPTVNEAIELCFKKGIISRTTIMANMPFYREAVQLSQQEGFFDKIGLHLTLDEFTPLTDSIKKDGNICKDGDFIMSWYRGLRQFFLSRTERQLVRDEIEAQMQRYVSDKFPLMHIDSHHHVHTKLSLLMIIIPLAKKYRFKSMRLAAFLDSDSRTKRWYKRLVNTIISSNFKATDSMMPYSNYLQTPDDVHNRSVEVMIHPDIVNGECVDLGIDLNIKLFNI